MDELEARVALTVAQKFTPLAQTNLLEHFGCAAAVVGAKAAEISKVPKVNRSGADALAKVIREGRRVHLYPCWAC